MDKNSKRCQRWLALEMVVGLVGWLVKVVMALAQKLFAERLDCITRTSQGPGKRAKILWAMRVPRPRRRWARRMKNSAMSQVVLLAVSSEPFPDEDEASWFVGEGDEEWVAGGVGEVEGELVVSEAAVRVDFYGVEFAKVVSVELEEVGEDRLVGAVGGDEFYRCGWLVYWLSHRWGGLLLKYACVVKRMLCGLSCLSGAIWKFSSSAQSHSQAGRRVGPVAGSLPSS